MPDIYEIIQQLRWIYTYARFPSVSTDVRKIFASNMTRSWFDA